MHKDPEGENLGRRSWLSAHISTKSPIYSAAYDRELVNEVVPLLAELSTENSCHEYFFVRYSDTGPHLRLRIRTIDDVMSNEVRSMIVKHARTFRRSVVWERYLPEFGRYGGALAMPATETLFAASSRAALSMVQEGDPDDRPRRYGQAMLAMIIFAHAITGGADEAARLLERYGNGTMPAIADASSTLFVERVRVDYYAQREALQTTVVELVERMELRRDELGPVFQSYYEAIGEYARELRHLHGLDHIRIGETAVEWRECAFRLSGSMMHMMNNRLGISIPDESYVSLLAARALRLRNRPGVS